VTLFEINIKRSSFLPSDDFKPHSLTVHAGKPNLKGKAHYNCPPCANQFRSAGFDISMIVSFFTKTNCPNEEVNCTDPSPFSLCSLVHVCSLCVKYSEQGGPLMYIPTNSPQAWAVLAAKPFSKQNSWATLQFLHNFQIGPLS
jgi:hypothetical protein